MRTLAPRLFFTDETIVTTASSTKKDGRCVCVTITARRLTDDRIRRVNLQTQDSQGGTREEQMNTCLQALSSRNGFIGKLSTGKHVASFCASSMSQLLFPVKRLLERILQVFLEGWKHLVLLAEKKQFRELRGTHGDLFGVSS